jgi:UPF0271 protein
VSELAAQAHVLLNLDAGEHDDEPDALYALAHALNVACGGHAGDDASMTRVLSAARMHGARAGVHPSYPDRAGFGRTTMEIDREALVRSLQAQCAALARIARGLGVPLVHAKLHGALYHDANRDPILAEACVRAVLAALGPVVIVGPPKGALSQLCAREGLSYAREGFADRAMREDGTLVPRSEPGALITDPSRAAAQALRLARDGCETICVHADTAGALEVARAVRAALDAHAAGRAMIPPA